MFTIQLAMFLPISSFCLFDSCELLFRSYMAIFPYLCAGIVDCFEEECFPRI